MAKVSPYTPLAFPWMLEGWNDDGYRQVFATTDRILVEVFGASAPFLYVYDALSRETAAALEYGSVALANGQTLCYATIEGLSEGCYVAEIDGLVESLPFIITEDEALLAQTSLVQYSMPDNRQNTEGVFLIDGLQTFFDMRVPGGFKASLASFKCANEQFETADSDLVSLADAGSIVNALVVGDGDGCPIWLGEMVNRALGCQDLYVNGTRYLPTEALSVEQLVETARRFVFTAKMAKAENFDPSREMGIRKLILRTLEDELRKTDNGNHRLLKR